MLLGTALRMLLPPAQSPLLLSAARGGLPLLPLPPPLLLPLPWLLLLLLLP
jgi:hypothetical protein